MKLTYDVTAEEMRTMLRIQHSKLDPELLVLKEAFLSELSMAGVNEIPADDKLTSACLRLYLRWQENYNGEADRYRDAFVATKNAMALSGRYKGGPADA